MKRRMYLKGTMLATVLASAMAVTSISVVATEVPQDMGEVMETDVVMDEEGTDTLDPESGIVDKTAPVLDNLTISATSVKAPGKIEVVAKASDDISGVESVSISFECDNNSVSAEYSDDYYIELQNTYFNENTKQTEKYEDGKFHGTLEFTPNTFPGIYAITYVTVRDNVGNVKFYYQNSGSVDTELPDYVKKISIEVEKSDLAPLKLKTLSLSETSVKAPGKIEVTAELDRESSDFKELKVSFKKTDSERYLDANLKKDDSGKFVGELNMDEYEVAGDYAFFSICIDEGESIYYFKNNPSIPDAVKSMVVKVSNDKVDSERPQIKNITLSSTEVDVPGKISFTIEGIDNVSGVNSVSVGFKNTKTKETVFGYCIPNYCLDGDISVDQYTGSGEYIISSINISDEAGNGQYYSDDNLGFDGYMPIPDNLKNLKFQVINDGETADVITSTISKSFLSDVKNAADNAIINVDITANKVIPKEIFDAVKGTNKMLRLNSDDIQWVVKGCGITGETKDVDLNGKINYNYVASDSELGAMLGEKKCLELEFAENAELPCKATVRFMLRAYMREWLGGTNNLYIYCYDETNAELEMIASEVALTKENNLEFDVTQGGEYILTYGPANTTSVVPDGPNTWESKEGTEGFVYRLYNVALTREAEEAGLNNWNTQLTGKTKTAAEVAQGIFFSEEFQNHEYSDVQYVKLLYRTMFGREADTVGLKGWLDKLNSGMSREYVFRGFAESQEFENLCNSYNIERGTVTLGQYRDKNEGATGYVARLYTKMLGRKFEETGIEYWCKEYLTGKVTIENIATNGFLHSQEFTNLNLSNEEFVTRMYQTFLNREPDEAGYKDWVGKLNSGEKTRDDLVYGFSLSQEFANLKKSYGL